MKYIIPLILITTLSFLSCNRVDDDFNVDQGYEYFPTEVGKWWEYQADSTIWDSFRNDTTYTRSFFVREEIVDAFTDSQGRPAVTINRSYSSDGSNWKKRDTWSASKGTHFVERVEENARFVKLAFPLLVLFPADDWDWDYSVTTNQATYTNGDLSFNEVIEIEQKPMLAETFLQKTIGVEQYVKGVGLVSKELTILKDDDIDAETPWPDKTHDGFIYKQKLINHN